MYIFYTIVLSVKGWLRLAQIVQKTSSGIQYSGTSIIRTLHVGTLPSCPYIIAVFLVRKFVLSMHSHTSHAPHLELIGERRLKGGLIILYIQRKIFFRVTIFLYSPCPNLEGIKDALFYKFRRLTIGQNCSAVCTNEVARA